MLATSIFCSGPGRALEPLRLAESGKTAYAIVVGAGCSAAERFAASELAGFLTQISGADYPIREDGGTVAACEIVVGATDRMAPGQVPAELRPDVDDGFCVLRQERRLLILGKIPRGTLYGVYDFLEEELGCRFLAPSVSHIPRQPTLDCQVTSRVYDPPLEYRNVGQVVEETWGVRNRLSACWEQYFKEAMLGAVRWVGPSFVHTFSYLVPADKYFEQHPEYFAMVAGTRARTAPGSSFQAQLCLTNAEVLRLTIAEATSWLEAYRGSARYHPHSRPVVSISGNDAEGWCECPDCQRANAEEGAPGGSLYRFVNAVAEALEQEHPSVLVETLAYKATIKPPAKTRPRANVIIRFAPIESDFSRTLDDPSSERNRRVCQDLAAWSGITRRLHVWNYTANFDAFFEPLPDLWVTDRNIRIFRQNGMRGMYAQGTMTPAGEMLELRNYLLAKCMWRPETDGRRTIEEFCRLYYGQAAPSVLEYIALNHNDFRARSPQPLTCRSLPFSDRFVAQADAILEVAEGSAETPEIRRRVTVARLPIWYLALTNEFGRAGQVLALPVEWRFRTDPQDRGLKERWCKAADIREWGPIQTDRSWTEQGHAYYGAAWYAVPFELPNTIRPDAALSLYFGAVDGVCDVFLDGQGVGAQKEPPEMMWNKGFYIPIKQGLAPGNHLLVVRVSKDNHGAGIWRPVTLTDRAQGVPAPVRVSGERFMEVSRSAGVTHMSEYYGKPGEQLESDFYPRVRALLAPSAAAAPSLPGAISQAAALLPNGFRAFSVEIDSTAQSGACTVQSAEQDWTVGQGVLWDVTRQVQAGEQAGRHYRLRVRVKVRRTGEAGAAFRFGFICWNEDWSGDGRFATVQARDANDGEWQWYEAPRPLAADGAFVRGQSVYVLPEKNPDNVISVCTDVLELTPLEN